MAEETSSLVEVPEFVGKNWSDISQQPYDGLKLVIIKEFNSDHEYHVVFDQSVPARSLVDRGTEIELYVSRGVETSSMPDLTNWDAVTAKGYLEELKVTVLQEREESDDVEVDHVIRTAPAAGETISEGQKVTIYISSGKSIKMAEVPGVVGAMIDQAKIMIEAQNLTYSISFEYSNDVKAERVIRQSPQSGTSVEEGTTINLVVSLGEKKISVPNLVGKTETEAKKALSDLNLNSRVETEESDRPEGEVLRHSPAAGEEVKEGETVVLYVSSGPKEEPTEPTEPETEPEPTTPIEPPPPTEPDQPDNDG